MQQVGLGSRSDADEVDSRLLVLVATAAVFLVYAASTWVRTLPMIAPDELGFISQAQLLAGVPAVNMGSEPYYHFGYSLLLVPVWWVTQDPLLAYKGFMLINAVLAALLVPLLVAIGDTFGFRRSPGLVLAAALVAIWPSSFFVSHFAWSDALFRLVFAANVWALTRVAHRPQLGWAILFAASAAALFAVHPKALLILALAPAALIMLRVIRVLDTRTLIAALVVFVVLVTGEMLAMDALHAALWHNDAYSAQQTLLGRIMRPEALFTGLIVVLGQLWYQLAASLGLAVLGVWFVIRYALARHPPVMRLAAGYTLAAALAVALASVIQMLEPLRVDHIAYGRYIDGASVVLVWLGLCWLVFGERGQGQRIAGVVVAAIILAGGLVLAAQNMMAGLESAHPENVAGLGWIFHTSSTPWQFFSITSMLLVVPAGLLLLTRRFGQLAVVAGFVVVASAFVHLHTAQHARAQLEYLSEDAGAIRAQNLAPLYWTDAVRQKSLWSYHLQYTLGTSFKDLDVALPQGAGLVSLEAGADGLACAVALPQELFLLANPPDAKPGC